MTTATNIQGTSHAKFRAVEDALRENFERFGEIGAALCVHVDGKPVIDIWGGHADAARTRPWERDTIVNVWSTTKGIVAACAHKLVQEGKLDLEAPVARYWPEFAQAGGVRAGGQGAAAGALPAQPPGRPRCDQRSATARLELQLGSDDGRTCEASNRGGIPAQRPAITR
jgi:CubicO group peptidase (beta-lactamase class C family)